MPLLIRAEIERLFRAGKIRFLVCTSTLIEGVNLPAQSIFVRGPRKGRGNPMGAMDFWNLAGRAGRQGKEFQGNVVCVDPREEEVWGLVPPRVRSRYQIRRQTESIFTTRLDELVAYVESGTPRSARKEYDDLEYAFVFLLGQQQRFGSLVDAPALARVPASSRARLDRICQKTIKTVELPPDFIFRHPGVSPLAQQRLLTFFRTRRDIETLVPSDPASSDALDSYKRVVGITSQYLSGDPLALTYPHALLVLNWMRGLPLARLIGNAWSYWKDHGGRLPDVIRRTMADIEEYARFRFAKYSSCYVDVLRFHLGELGADDLAREIPRLSFWLEFGTSIRTQLSLIGLGLSRTSAIAISEYIPQADLDPDAALRELRSLLLDGLDLSPVIVAEVRRVRGDYVERDSGTTLTA